MDIEEFISQIADKSTPTDCRPGYDESLFSHCDYISISALVDVFSRQGLWAHSAALHQFSVARRLPERWSMRHQTIVASAGTQELANAPSENNGPSNSLLTYTPFLNLS